MKTKTFIKAVDAYGQAVEDYQEKFGPYSLDYTVPVVNPLATEPELWFKAAKKLRQRIDNNDPLSQEVGDPEVRRQVIY